MIKRALITGVLVISIWAVILCVHGRSEDNGVKVIEKGSETTAEMVNNRECPVSEDEINPATAVMVEYKGKIYSLCCPACAKHFQKFPEKFSQKTSKK